MIHDSVQIALKVGLSTILLPVHNQRIERLWRDVFEICLSPLYHTFYNLEEQSLLDPGDDYGHFVVSITSICPK